MLFNFNEEIEEVLSDIGVPVAFMFYEGSADTYITYMQTDKDSILAGEDEIIGCVQFYDFDIFSKSNYLNLINNLIDTMVAAGWTYQPNRDSPDMYERDTKYYHKTICLAKESEVI